MDAPPSDDPTPGGGSADAATQALVPQWLTLPDVADRLGTDVGKVRRMVQEGRLAAVRTGEPPVQRVPAGFLVPGHLANPAAPLRGGAPEWAVLASLQGTLTVLGDVGFSAAESIAWLHTPDESLDGTPLDALREGRKTQVRRLAQAQL